MTVALSFQEKLNEMYKKFLPVLAISLLTTFGFAQETTKKMKVTSFTLLPSVMFESNPSGSIDDFRALAPNSTLLPTNLDGYTTNNFYYTNGSINSSFLLGFKFSDKEGKSYKWNPIFRAGLTYSANQSLSSSAYKEIRTPYDTLISTKTGESFAVDSTSYSSYYMEYYSQQLRLDISILFSTNPTARWTLFGGVGASVGASINAFTRISTYEYSYIIPYENQGVAYYNKYQDQNNQQEQITNEMNIGYSAYIPLGVDFRISNNNPFWNKIHLFYEMRPSLNFTSIPELRTISNPAFQQGLGVKIQWE
jgi:hypothetical protein